MSRSNTANGGNSYFDLEFQVLADDGVNVALRLVVYLTSLNVSDSTNSFEVWGDGYSRGGAVGLGGTYNRTPIWSQDTTHQRAIGSWRTLNVGARISGVNYWGVTLEAYESFNLSPRYEAPSSPPIGVDSIGPTSARIVVSPSSYGGGAGIDAYEAYVLTNNAWPGQGGNVVASASGGTFTATNLLPGTRYYYTARARNQAGIWSAWSAMQVFDTLPAAMVKYGGVYRNALVYVKYAGTWRIATPYVKYAGTWRIA